ncbi:MAG TPA: hypothetical protein VGY99_20330 [Candidatus Binataceae bacterium]|jgi:hypothetical protein|nr:hypothetical protein [Candidatus Binataceae bacterium]
MGCASEPKVLGGYRPTGIRSTYAGRLEAADMRIDPKWFER